MLKFSIYNILNSNKTCKGLTKSTLHSTNMFTNPVKPLYRLLQLVEIHETRIDYLDRYFQLTAPRLFKIHFKLKQRDIYRSNAAPVFGIVYDNVDYNWPEKNYIRVELVQKNRKNHYLQLYNESNDTVRF